jgi:hypothetical protein
LKTTKEEALASLTRFVQEYTRYPTKADCREHDWLVSQPTYIRLLGTRENLTILSDWLEQHPELKPPERLCKHCGASISKEQKQNEFCSRSCSATYNNLHRAPLKKRTKKEKLVGDILYKLCDVTNCIQCSKPLINRQSIFCSLRCQADHRFDLAMRHWLDTGEAPGGNPALRKYITHLDGYKCSCCGLFEWNGRPITLEVEHKNGNSEDDSRDNVCLICPNCHSQTDTYKGKNRGKGRHARAQRYRDGKSY